VSDAKSPAACAEFPNDNSSLHSGAIWRCANTCEHASVELPTSRSMHPARGVEEEAGEFASEDDWPDDVEIVDELSFEGEIFEEVPAHPLPVPPAAAADASSLPVPGASGASGSGERDRDPYRLLVDRIARVARDAGGGDPAARGARWLLGSLASDAEGTVGLPTGAWEALAAPGYVDTTYGGLRASDAFRRKVTAWQGVLRGDSEDFSECGSTPLDEWSADIVARLLGSPSRAAGLRQDLRRLGVAAFGLVDDGQ
jgi:hypothetical protein